MTDDLQDILARFHRALVREIKSNKPEALTAPFSVAEIYQNLVPYRTHRDEIGVEINGDYEHALLRLLAGEGEFLTIESRTARQEIKEELDSPNPNTSLYRDFAAADVLLNPDRIDEALEGWQSPEGPPEHEVGEEVEAPGVNAEESDPAEAEARAPAPAEEELPGDSSFQEEEEKTTDTPEGAAEAPEKAPEAPDEAPPPSLEEVVEASSPVVPEEVAGEEGQEEWRDPTTWLEPSIETLREEYERNREASLLETGEAGPLETGEASPPETGEAFQAAEEVASEGLPFEVSVRRGEESEMEDSPEEEEDRVDEAAAGAVAVGVAENCAWCREKLPDRPGVNFCPFCGMSVKLVPCPDCGEELELNWRFCIACGTEVSS